MLCEVLFSYLKTDRGLILIIRCKITAAIRIEINNNQTINYEIQTIYMRSDLGTVPVSLLK